MSRRKPPRKNHITFVASAVAVGGYLAYLTSIAPPGHHHGHGGILDSLGTAHISSGSSYTPRSWARELLRIEGEPRNDCTMRGVLGWIRAEGSNWSWRNPLDTTQPEPGSAPVNSVKVQAFTSWHASFKATDATLRNGLYGSILAALHAGSDAQSIADAVASSQWGTGSFTATC